MFPGTICVRQQDTRKKAFVYGLFPLPWLASPVSMCREHTVRGKTPYVCLNEKWPTNPVPGGHFRGNEKGAAEAAPYHFPEILPEKLYCTVILYEALLCPSAEDTVTVTAEPETASLLTVIFPLLFTEATAGSELA